MTDESVGDLIRFHDFHQFPTDAWTGPLDVDTATTPDWVRVKWANYNNFGGTERVEFVYIKGGHLYYDTYSLNQQLVQEGK